MSETEERCPFLGSHDGAHVCLSREDDVLVISPRYVEAYCQRARHVECALYQRAGDAGLVRVQRMEMERVPVAEIAGLSKSRPYDGPGGGDPGHVTVAVESVIAGDRHAEGEEPAVFPSGPPSSDATHDITPPSTPATTETVAAGKRSAGKEEPTLVDTQPVVRPGQKPPPVEPVTLEPSGSRAGMPQRAETPAAELRPESKGEASSPALEAAPAVSAAGPAPVEDVPEQKPAATADQSTGLVGPAAREEMPDSEPAAGAPDEPRSVLSSVPPGVGQDLLARPDVWSPREAVPTEEPERRTLARLPIVAAVVVVLLCLGAGAALLSHFSGGATKGLRPTPASRPALVGPPHARTAQATPVPTLAPSAVWRLPSVSTPIDQAVLLLTNPNSLPVHVSIHSLNGATVLDTTIPARNGAEADLAPPDASRGLIVRAAKPIFLQRSLIRHGRVVSSQAGKPS